jgi:two-component system phosphate regulon response regulator PhoB
VRGESGHPEIARPAHVLIVEDERDLSRLMARALRKEGFSAAEAATVGEARAALRARPPACLLLDLMLPDASGLDFVRELRARPGTARLPVIIVTAKGDEVDRVVGFELGADDYVAKPFSPRELVLRVKAVLRRAAGGTEDAPGPLEAGPLRVDEAAHRAWASGRELSLTALEFKLLAHLVRHAGRVQTRDVLLERVWGYDADVSTRTLDTHVKRLRAKLGDARAAVETVRGVGYRVAAT